MEKFIRGTYKKHSITEDGIVYNHYRLNKNGKRIYNKKPVVPYLNGKTCKTAVVSLQFGKWSPKNGVRTRWVTTLMEEHFGLTPPDKFHYYDLVCLDGNPFNLARKNLGYRIRTLDSSEYKFYPQPFYNKYGRITHKICAECGDKKKINNFHLQPVSRRGKHETYRNICESCRSSRFWERLKADDERFAKRKKVCADWGKSEKGRDYRNKYLKVDRVVHRANITPRFISGSIKMPVKDMTPEIVSLAKKKITIHREILKIKKS